MVLCETDISKCPRDKSGRQKGFSFLKLTKTDTSFTRRKLGADS